MEGCDHRRPRPRAAAAQPSARLRALTAALVLTTALLLASAAGTARAQPGDPAVPAAGVTPATTSATTSASTRATELRRQVEALEQQVEVAAEDHDAAAQQLGVVVSEQIGAGRALAAAQLALRGEELSAGRRARAVQQVPGGRLGLALGVVQGADPDDVLDRYRAIASLVGSDQRRVRAAHELLDRAVTASAQVQDLTRRQQQLEADADRSAQAARDALDARAALLATADAQVAALAEADRERSERQATDGAASSLAALGADPSTPPATGAAAAAIAAALTRLGDPYAWGATGPDSFDCSGLVQWSYAQAGVQLPRTTRQLYAALPPVPLADLQPGDLVLYASGADPATIHHVGLYLGNGLVVHAPHTGDVVRVASAAREGVYAAVRPTGAPQP